MLLSSRSKSMPTKRNAPFSLSVKCYCYWCNSLEYHNARWSMLHESIPIISGCWACLRYKPPLYLSSLDCLWCLQRSWQEAGSHVKIPKWSPFSKCSICHELKTRRDLATSSEAKAFWQSLLDAHVQEVNKDRAIYDGYRQVHRLALIIVGPQTSYVHQSTSCLIRPTMYKDFKINRRTASGNPNAEYLSVVVDFISNWKANYPHISNVHKKLADGVLVNPIPLTWVT